MMSYIQQIDMLEQELFIYLISKQKVDGTKYDHKWAQDLCAVVFTWPRLVDIWINNSKDIKKEIKEYNYHATHNVNHADTENATRYAILAASYANYAKYVTADVLIVGFWKARSKDLLDKLHELIPAFKYDSYADIEKLVNQQIQAKLKQQRKWYHVFTNKLSIPLIKMF